MGSTVGRFLVGGKRQDIPFVTPFCLKEVRYFGKISPC